MDITEGGRSIKARAGRSRQELLIDLVFLQVLRVFRADRVEFDLTIGHDGLLQTLQLIHHHPGNLVAGLQHLHAPRRRLAGGLDLLQSLLLSLEVLRLQAI